VYYWCAPVEAGATTTPDSKHGVFVSTELHENIAPDAEGSCPSWCVGCDDGEAVHANEFEGPILPMRDDEAIARLVQEGDSAPVVELGVNDADGGSACVRLSLAQARELADLLNDLITDAELG
jgi:hypothetical protein